jgi:serine/threonine protein kinase
LAEPFYVKRFGNGVSTRASSIDTLPTIPRLSARLRVAGARRVHPGQFSSGEVVPGTRYRVVGLIGRGGMGLVYEVEHLELGKRFVLKALLSDLAGREDIVARLRNEQRALGRLQHPNIVAVTDAGVTSTNLPYFVMERLDGETLGARLRRQHKLPILEAMTIARSVLDGLSAAHEIGVVHRDVKPQNIFVLRENRAKILDFGVAKVADAASVITARGIAIGTPRYMSPEQVGGDRVDGRSDLYAVGLVLFECVTGRGPFDDIRDANEMLLAHRGKPAPRLGAVAAGVTGELDALVASLLAKSPDERPPTARAAAAALAVVIGRYGGGSNLDAPTPHASHSTIARAVLASSGGASGYATRPDGLAARGGTHTIPMHPAPSGTTQVLSPTWADADVPATAMSPRQAPGGTLYDASSRAVTVARPNAIIPSDAMRTERLEPTGLSLPADEPTHTRIPTTPSEGTRSLPPVPLDGPRSRRPAPAALWLGAAALVVVALGTSLLVGGRRNGDVSTSAGTEAEAAAYRGLVRREGSAASTAATPSSASAVPSAQARPPTASASGVALPSAQAPSAPARSNLSPAGPGAPGASAAAPPRVRPSPSSGPRAARTASPAPVARELPGSGL